MKKKVFPFQIIRIFETTETVKFYLIYYGHKKKIGGVAIPRRFLFYSLGVECRFNRPNLVQTALNFGLFK